MADETPKRTPTPVNAAGSDNSQDNATPQNSADTGANTAQEETTSDSTATIEARILRAHGDYAVNTLALLTPAEAQSGEGDWCDTHPDAVAYVKALA